MGFVVNPPILTESTSYELWKLETRAWTLITDLGKEKQAIAVALNLPNGEKNGIKERVFDELELNVLKRENGMDILFQFLDKHLLEDELVNSLKRFEEFEIFERQNNENIREYVAKFDLKFRKLEKLNIIIPSEIVAFKLLRKANLSRHDRMIVLTGVNFVDKENMYKDMKYALIKFLGHLTEDDRTRHDVKLEPAWKIFASSSKRTGYIQQDKNVTVRKKLNSLGSNGKTLLCHSCGSYRHLVADCPDSWENIVNQQTSGFDMKQGNLNRNDELKNVKNGRTDPFEPGEECGIPFVSKQIAEEVTKLTMEISNLKDEINALRDVKLRMLKRQEEETSHEKMLLEEINRQQKENCNSLEGLIIKKSQEEHTSRLLKALKKVATMDCFSKQSQYIGRTIEEKDSYWLEVKEKKDSIKLAETNLQDSHINMKDSKIPRIDENQI